ncbi:MAG: hypothetical protein ACT4O6_09200 [Reyranella sp.]
MILPASRQVWLIISYFSQDVGEMCGKSAVAVVVDGVGLVSVYVIEMAKLAAPLPAAVLSRVGMHALLAAEQNRRS